jgi:hypothetical protein
MRKISALLLLLALFGAPAFAGETPSSADAKLAFANLKDGDVVASPVHVQFILTGMAVAPAGTQTPNTGHHHLFIDAPLDPKALNEPIPSDAQHLHFGKGQTEADINLPAGPHSLQLVLGDWTHKPHNPPVVSELIHITVK